MKYNKERIFAAGLIAIAMMFILGSPVQALCLSPQEEGQWKNYDSNTRSITKTDIRFVCQDQILNGKPYPPGSPYYVHIWGSCSPNDCDWGEVGASRDSEGWIRATYNQGFATRYVWIRSYDKWPGYLRVYIWTDFSDPNRKDYAMDEWFIKR